MRPYHPFERNYFLRELRTMLRLPLAIPWERNLNVISTPSGITDDDRRIVEAELRWIGNASVMVDYKAYWETMG